ncbi:glycosyltransferase [Mammaliicoccus sciuri]|uniref:glycosyltransferase n=1 Tax=Mammaliicoccus sciuri TaxID=1296 RepID=UPI002DB90242|nr:glycosyltransferase [Mammaliicoccus sciuri]MEB7844846.1 glycosyltransferase [Mammaliicoccus sciuri]
MKSLIVTNYYLPGIKGGGPVNSIKNIVENVDGNFDILTKSKDVGEKVNYKNVEINNWNISGNNRIYYLGKINFLNIYYILKKEKYDLIYLNSLFATLSIFIYILTIFTKTRIIIAPRGELNSNALLIKKFKKMLFKFLLKFYVKFKKVSFHATSKDEEKDIKKNFNVVIDTIPNLPSKANENVKLTFKTKNSIKVMCVARINKMKNIHYAINRLNEVKEGEVIFDIYGAIEDKDYKKYCETIPLNKNIEVNYKGNTSKEILNKKYKEYNLFFLPTLGENFGHSIIEAIQNHIPVLISDNTPWKNLQNKKVGYEFPLDSKNEFENCLVRLVKMNNDEFESAFTGFESFVEYELNTVENIKRYYSLLVSGE